MSVEKVVQGLTLYTHGCNGRWVYIVSRTRQYNAIRKSDILSNNILIQRSFGKISRHPFLGIILAKAQNIK